MKTSGAEVSFTEKGEIRLKGEISEKNVSLIMDAFAVLSVRNPPAITLYINSVGGSVREGLELFYQIENMKRPIIGIVRTKASSMAVILLQACATRRAHSEATFLIHDLYFEGSGTLGDAASALRERKQKEVYGILSRKTGRSMEEIAAKCRENKKMSAEEALAFGLIDEVIK